MSWTDVTDALANNLPNYEPRVEQDRLATAIENSVENREILLGQAGCGTGKSFAYLAAAIDAAKASRKPSVVATATKALQGQLADKDLPFLSEILGDVRFSVLKGRGNYVCLAKLNDSDAANVPGVTDLREELENDEEHTGDLDELKTEIDPRFRLKLTATSDECPGKRDCPFGEECYAEMAKQRAADAHVVVANQALLLRDAQVKDMTSGTGSILPHYGALFIDEAHELEDYATGALGQEVTQRGLTRFAEDVANFLGDGNAADAVRSSARMLFDQLNEQLGRDNTRSLSDELLADASDDLVSVLTAVTSLKERVFAHRTDGDNEQIKHRQMKRRCNSQIEKLREIILAESDVLVRWIEREVRTVRGQKEETIKLAFAPLHVGPALRRLLWDNASSATLTSATLAVGTDFTYIAGRLGIDTYSTFDAGTPFDFARQAGLYIPQNNFPEPREGSWATRVIAETGELVRQSGGRALLLYTSRTAMNNAHSVLAPMIERMGYTVLKQGDAPTGKLTQQFKDDETSVLFALKSFMTGADFQGDTLRLVVLDKLPFAVPSDVVFNARCEAIDATASAWKDKAFMKLSVPSMALTLLQAFGRAIRTKSDEALVVIFDPRIKTKGYGKTILNALPDARPISNLADAMAYLGDLHARRG